METRTLGRTGLQVTPLCLGAMMLGPWGNRDENDCVRIVHAALDAGINFIDTADVYSLGASEEIVGKALADGRRDKVILATKFHAPMGEGPNMSGNSRRWIMQEVEASLRRLRTDWIDLYQAHRPDPSCDLDETLGALSDLVHQGKVRYLGCSTFPADLVVESQWVAARKGLERFVCEQPPYSILARSVEASLLPACQRFGMGAIVWSPLNGGWLSGRHRRDLPPAEHGRAARTPVRFDRSRPEVQAKLEAVERLAAIADEAGMPLAHLAIAFVLAHPAVTCAIIGPRTMDQLESLIGAEALRLDWAVLDRIDEVVPPGKNLDPEDAGWTPPAIADPSLRRRAELRVPGTADRHQNQEGRP